MGFPESRSCRSLRAGGRYFGKFAGVAVIEHALDELVLKRVDTAGEFEGRHGAAELIGFGRREARCHHGDLHRLFLKERYT